MSGIRITKHAVALLAMCLVFVASVTAAAAQTNSAGVSTGKADSPTVLTVENGNLMLNGQRFFIVAADAFSACPTTAVVDGYKALHVNTIIHWYMPCGRGVDITADWMHGMLEGLWWLELSPASPPGRNLDGLPELLQVQGSFDYHNIQRKPGRFFNCESNLNTSTAIFDEFHQAQTNGNAIIYSTILADPISSDQPNCMTSRELANLIWVLWDVGAAGIQMTLQTVTQDTEVPPHAIPGAGETIKTQFDLIHSLPCMVKGQPIKVKQGQGGLRLAAWRYNGKVCTSAVNTVDRPLKARFSLPAAAKGAAKVMWEGRTETPVNGVVSDDFKSLGHRVYMTNAK